MEKQRRYRRGRRRRMEKFVLGEISFVDRPAQELAEAKIQKMSVDELLKDGIEKFRGPRTGETFEEYFERILLDQPLLPERVARIMFDRGSPAQIEEDEMDKIAKQLPAPREDEERNQYIARVVAKKEQREEFDNRELMLTVAHCVYDAIVKQRGPREGESFEDFLARMRREDPGMSRSRARRMFDGDMEKAGDLVDLSTSSNDDHQHGIKLIETPSGVGVIVSFASAPEGEMHDHQVTRDESGNFVLTENRGHTHTVDQQEMRDALIDASMAKQGPSAEERRRLAGTGAALPDGSFPIRNREDLTNAISAFGRARSRDRQRVANHIRRRARALGLTDMLPEEGVLADLLKNSDEPKEKEMDDLEKAKEQNEQLQAQVANLTKVAAMNADHRAHYDTLDDDAKKAFVEKSDDDRNAEIAKATDSDPVVYTADDGTEYRKSDDERLVKLAKDRDADRKEAIRLQAAAKDADLSKRAETDLANFPGDIETRKAILRKVDEIENEDVRKAASDALKAQNAKLASAFEVIGVQGSPSFEKSHDRQSAVAELDRLAKERASKESESYVDAYAKVSEANPELLQKAVG